MQATQVELCDITGGWKPRVPCHHPTHTTLASTAIIWKGDKVALALCALSCAYKCNYCPCQQNSTRIKPFCVDVDLAHIRLTPIFIALERGSATSPGRNAVK